MAVSARTRIVAPCVLVALPAVLLALAGLLHPHHLTPDAARTWASAHIWLLPLWPLLAVGVLVPLWGMPWRGVAGVAKAVAVVGGYGYAVLYTGLDAVAGIAAGTARLNETTRDGSVVGDLFATGDRLGYAGVYCLLAAVVATAAALWPTCGTRVLPGLVVLIPCCLSFVDSHIFWPRGGVTMIGFAVGFVLLTFARFGMPDPGRPSGQTPDRRAATM